MEYSPQAAVRSVYENMLIQKADNMGLPMLGVCAGAQRINVALGGGMVQHVPDLVGHEEHSQEPFGLPPTKPVHPVVLEGASRADALAQKAEAGRFDVSERYIIDENSRHHQAIDPDKLGHGLKVTGWAVHDVPGKHEPVKTVEIIESTAPNRWLVATQFHPEYEASKFGKSLIQAFTAASKQFAHDHPLEQPPQLPRTLPLPLYRELKTEKSALEGGWVQAAQNSADIKQSR
jgi:gamma-glutamyl-gamma-aminobutyrate hydrolase PuuD